MNLRQAAEQIIAWYAEGQRPTGDDIVDTLREALAQPERRCEAGVSLQDLWDCWDAVHGGKQEPTAWMDAVGDLTFRTPSVKLRPYWTPLYLHPTPVPEGWQLVPNEPTPKMCHAAFKDRNGEFSSASQWSAMLAAAPKLPSGGPTDLGEQNDGHR